MGLCRINGPDALPLRPAGPEKLGQATNNICEAGFKYCDATENSWKRLPSPGKAPREHKSEVRHGQNTALDVETVHFVRHCERIDGYTRSRAEERARRQALKAGRKARRKAKKAAKKG